MCVRAGTVFPAEGAPCLRRFRDLGRLAQREAQKVVLDHALDEGRHLLELQRRVPAREQ